MLQFSSKKCFTVIFSLKKSLPPPMKSTNQRGSIKYGYFEYCISWIILQWIIGSSPSSISQYGIGKFVEIIIISKDDDFNKFPNTILWNWWWFHGYDPLQVNSTDAIFKIAIIDWSPLTLPTQRKIVCLFIILTC